MNEKATNSLKDKQLYNIVSLGCFCSVAMELERIGLRNCSLPFDWVISGNLNIMMDLIENNFIGFAEKENLYQETEVNPAYYYDTVSQIHFYHDFSPYKSFDDQYEAFKTKYSRRISRFYDVIKEPTIFLRYCHSEKELEYIEENYALVCERLMKYNPHNKIIFITSIEKNFNIENLYYVERDVGETVARSFLVKLPELKEYLMENSVLQDEVENNLKIYKRSKRKRFFFRLVSKISRTFKKKVYLHSLQYSQLKH